MTSARAVAHLVPYSISFPLDRHNGRYDWVIDLATRQAAAGLTVTIYSNPASSIDIPGVSFKSVDGAYSDTTTANNALLLQALQDETIDIYHSHFDNLHYQLASNTSKPIVCTQHWWPSQQTIAMATNYRGSNVWAVPPTSFMFDFDRQHNIQTQGYIHHGIDLRKFRFLQQPKSARLLLVGKITPQKNVATAINAALKAGLGLDIVGSVTSKYRTYWEQLQPMVDGEQIRYLGPKSSQELVGCYNAARALIFPSEVSETFGLVAVESQACGTPVLMQKGGSRRELVADGTTGFLCESEAEFAAAALKSKDIAAEDCVRFAQQFDINRMVSDYLQLYETLLG